MRISQRSDPAAQAAAFFIARYTHTNTISSLSLSCNKPQFSGRAHLRMRGTERLSLLFLARRTAHNGAYSAAQRRQPNLYTHAHGATFAHGITECKEEAAFVFSFFFNALEGHGKLVSMRVCMSVCVHFFV